MVLAATAEFDNRLRNLAPEEARNKVSAWAQALSRTNLSLEDLLEGVLRAYRDARRPDNPVGAIIQEAKAHRLANPRARELPANVHIGGVGYAIPAAYEIDDVLHIQCECGAKPGEYCTHNGETKKIPHETRLATAWRLNNPEGRRLHQEREQHLARFRKTNHLKRK